jgi:AraC-like DNA-binding protein
VAAALVADADADPAAAHAAVLLADPNARAEDVAAQAGYADQAHLTRECRALAGLTPAALARQRGPAV